jgi:hypothetical protein
LNGVSGYILNGLTALSMVTNKTARYDLLTWVTNKANMAANQSGVLSHDR